MAKNKNPNENYKSKNVNTELDPATLFEGQKETERVPTSFKTTTPKKASKPKAKKTTATPAAPKYGTMTQGDVNITLDQEGLDFIALSSLLAATGFDEVEDYLASDDEMVPRISGVENGDDPTAAKFMTLAKVIYVIGAISSRVNGISGKLDTLLKSVNELKERFNGSIDCEADLATPKPPCDGDAIVIRGDMYGDIIYGDKLHNYGGDEDDEGADDDDDYDFSHDGCGCKCHDGYEDDSDEDEDDDRTLRDLTDSIVMDIISKVATILYEACLKLGDQKFTKEDFLKKYGFLVESFIPEEVLSVTDNSRDEILNTILDVVHSAFLDDGKSSIFTDGEDIRTDDDDEEDGENIPDEKVSDRVIHLLRDLEEDGDTQ